MKDTADIRENRIKRRQRRNSILLIIAIAAAATVMLIAYSMHMSGVGRPELQITVGGKLYGTYDLDKDQTIQIGHTNTCEIRDGKVYMTEANCPDQICVKSAPISASGGSIVCMPNRVVLSIIHADSSENAPDTVAG